MFSGGVKPAPASTKREAHAVLGLVVGPVEKPTSGVDRREAGQGGANLFSNRNPARLATLTVHRQLRTLNVRDVHAQGLIHPQACMGTEE